MKKIILLVMTFAVFAPGVSFVQAQIKVNPKAVKMIKPDLKITSIQTTKTTDNFIVKLSVTVANGCEAMAGQSYLLVKIKESAEKNAKTLLTVGKLIPELKGGASYTHNFLIEYRTVPASGYIYAEADIYNKISEGDENNNWMSRRADGQTGSPFPTAGVCEPK